MSIKDTDIVIKDNDGFPILLANVANSGAVTKDPNAAGGNPNHDTRSGKFGSGGTKKTPNVKQNTDPELAAELRRRQDAIRDAARSLTDVTAETAKAFLEKRVANVDAVDLDSFLAEVHLQKLNDVTDAIYANVNSGGLLSKKKGPYVAASKGYLKGALNGLQDAEIADVFKRLVARGVDNSIVVKQIIPAIKDESRRNTLEQDFGALNGK